jgi:hypothetical protein
MARVPAIAYVGSTDPLRPRGGRTKERRMSDLLDLHRIATDADYDLALDELEQLMDVAPPRRSERAQELSAMIAEYEARVAAVLAQAVKARAAVR